MKTKTDEEILNSLKKANKTRREVMVKKLGYSSYESAIADLSGKPLVAQDKETVHIVNLLDVSSSMNEQNKIARALEGLNAEVEKLSGENNVDYVYSLTTFSYHYSITKQFNRVPIKSLRNIKFGANGMTALNDAIGKVLTELKESISVNKERIVVSIFTDGEENNSVKFSNFDISKLVEECQALGMVITFIGTEKDTKDVIKNFKIDVSNTISHDNTSKGVSNSFKSKIGATVMYSNLVAEGVPQEQLTRGFYSKQTGKL